MAGRTPFTPQSLGDPRLDSLQEAIAAKLLELDDAVAALASPLVLPTARDAQVTDQVLVDYRGPGGHTIRLPRAEAAGKGRASFVHVLNSGLGPVGVAAVGKDTVNGAKAITLDVGSAFLGMSNGESAWSSVRTQVAPTVDQAWYSVVDNAAFFGASGSRNTAGNFTVGHKFTSTRDLVCTGARFWWKANGSTTYTVRVSIFIDQAGPATVTKDISVQASGIYTVKFDTPQTLLAYRGQYCTMWETSGTRYTSVDINGTTGPQGFFPIIGMVPIGPFTIGRTFCRYEPGNGIPTNTSTSELFPVEPIFAPFSLE